MKIILNSLRPILESGFTENSKIVNSELGIVWVSDRKTSPTSNGKCKQGEVQC